MMQHLKIRHKRCIEVQDLRTKEAQVNSEGIHEVGSQPAQWWRTGQWTIHVWCAPDCPVGHRAVCAERPTIRHSRDVAPDCPVCTRQSSNGRIQRSTATDPNCRLMWPGHQTVNSACLVCTELSDAPVDRNTSFLFNGYNWGGKL
jgi:hypothetical protein